VLDGLELGEARDLVVWEPTRGPPRSRSSATGARTLDRVRFEVRGGEAAARPPGPRR